MHEANGAPSGTLILFKNILEKVIRINYVLNGKLGSEARIILKVTLFDESIIDVL